MRGINHNRGNRGRSGKTFGQAAAKWIVEWDGKDSRRQSYAIESLLPYIGNMPLGRINNSALERFKEDRLEGRGCFSRPAMASTVNKELTIIITIMNVAAEIWEWIDYVPKIRHVKGPQRQPYPLTWAEQDALFSYLSDWWATGPALFAVNTGVRASEMFGLKWEHITPFMERTIAVTDGKNGYERAVVCNSLATLAIENQKGNGSEYIFPSRASSNMGGRIKNWSKPFDVAWRKAGLPCKPLVKRGIHNLRHTCGHRLRAAGVPAEDRNLLLGHSNANLSEHYAQPDLERLMEHAEKVTRPRTGKPEIILRSIRSAV